MRVNLLPPETKERQVGRRRTGIALVLGVVLLGLLGTLYVFQQLRLAGVERDLETQEATNAELRAQVAELQQFDDLQRELSASQQLVTVLLADEVEWSGILRDISLVIPGRVWLSTFSGTVTTPAAATAGTPPAEPSGLVGQLTFEGFGLVNHRDTALWLSRLEEVEGFVNPWVTLSELSQFGANDVAQFTGTTDLSDRALASARGGQV